jgi:hypothetical protein
MRRYIHQVVQHTEDKKPTTFELSELIADAWFWKTQEDAEGALHIWGGISGCTDVRVEPRSEAGFVISCETELEPGAVLEASEAA